MVQQARQTGDSPLLIVDIALPRDVDASVATLASVTLRDLDDLSKWAQRGIESRAAEVDQVKAIISEEVDRFALDRAQRQAAPLVAQLREVVETLRKVALSEILTLSIE
jgi:glutamyl-tRNA reductase